MNVYSLDGNRLREPQEAYDYLASRLGFPEYFGKNLDALWDLISERRQEHYIFYHHEGMNDNIQSVFLDSHHALSFDDDLRSDMNLTLVEDGSHLEILGEDLNTTVLSFKALQSVHGLLVEECLLTSDDCLIALIRVLEQYTEKPLILESEVLEKAFIEQGYESIDPLLRVRR